jgi:hypothetical protein
VRAEIKLKKAAIEDLGASRTLSRSIPAISLGMSFPVFLTPASRDPLTNAVATYKSD